MERQHGPAALWLVRHGESEGNLADARAHERGAGRLAIDLRDPDVALSSTGCAQAEALGRWLAALPGAERPTAVSARPTGAPCRRRSWRPGRCASRCAPTSGCASATWAPSTA